jgi:hypothetical protein
MSAFDPKRTLAGSQQNFQVRHLLGSANAWMPAAAPRPRAPRPPRSVLRQYYKLHPQFEIDYNDYVRPGQPLDYRTELALNDAILVDVLRSAPTCVFDRASFWAECERRSMNVNTFSLYSTYSPVIVHLGTDLWSLRGVQGDPVAVEAVRHANALRTRERRVLDHGWMSDGRLWFAARLPNASGGFVFGIPGGIKRFVAGRQFAIKDEDGVDYGGIRVNEEGATRPLFSLKEARY